MINIRPGRSNKIGMPFAPLLQNVVRAKCLSRLLRLSMIASMYLLCNETQAQVCSVSSTGIVFPNYSPIASAAVSSVGIVTVTCTWPQITPLVNALVCINLTAASPRNLLNGNNKLAYDLWTDPAHATQWGSTTAGTTPLSVMLTKPAGITASATLPFYGQVPGNQTTVPTANNAATPYSVTYTSQASALAGFYILKALPPTCVSLAVSAGVFPLTATDTVINNCTIVATGLTFQTGANGLLHQDLTAQGFLTVICTANDAYTIALSPGASANQTARTMTAALGSDTVKYQLYTDEALSLVWGDGTSGTVTSAGIGTGMPQTLAVFGKVPAQSPTPAPSIYSDIVIATVYF